MMKFKRQEKVEHRAMIFTRVPAEMERDLLDIAEAERATRSEVVRVLLGFAIEEYKRNRQG